MDALRNLASSLALYYIMIVMFTLTEFKYE